MASPRNQDKAVKFVQQLVGTACVVRKAFLLGPLDLSLNGVFMEAAKNLL